MRKYLCISIYLNKYDKPKRKKQKYTKCKQIQDIFKTRKMKQNK